MDSRAARETSVAIETSGSFGSVAIRAGGTLEFSTLETARAQARDLLPELASLLERAGVERRQGTLALDAIYVGTGPGSYTGLRIGIATALGLQQATGARLRGVASFEALAFRELAADEEGTVALDARAGRFYFARFRRTAQDIEAILAPCALPRGELLDAMPAAGPLFVDASFERSFDLTPELRSRVRIDAIPRADAVLELGTLRMEQHGPQAPEEVEPLYLRAFGE